jgi:hypothetical protein
MISRLLFITGAVGALVACDPTPSGGDPEPSGPPCAEAWGDNSVLIGIEGYEWDGATYYVAVPDCCDQFESVVDASTCEYVCAAGGGFSGRGDGNCPTFYEDATHTGTVWTRE